MYVYIYIYYKHTSLMSGNSSDITLVMLTSTFCKMYIYTHFILSLMSHVTKVLKSGLGGGGGKAI